jgi:hypothetical protein
MFIVPCSLTTTLSEPEEEPLPRREDDEEDAPDEVGDEPDPA